MDRGVNRARDSDRAAFASLVTAAIDSLHRVARPGVAGLTELAAGAGPRAPHSVLGGTQSSRGSCDGRVRACNWSSRSVSRAVSRCSIGLSGTNRGIALAILVERG